MFRRHVAAMISGPAIGIAAVIGALALSLVAGTSSADDEDERVLMALEHGDVVPLESLLARIRRDFGGRTLKVELDPPEEDEDDASHNWIYEAKVLTSHGSVLKLEYDAKSLELLELKGDHRRPTEGDQD